MQTMCKFCRLSSNQCNLWHWYNFSPFHFSFSSFFLSFAAGVSVTISESEECPYYENGTYFFNVGYPEIGSDPHKINIYNFCTQTVVNVSRVLLFWFDLVILRRFPLITRFDPAPHPCVAPLR